MVVDSLRHRRHLIRERPIGMLIAQALTGLWSAFFSVAVVAWSINVVSSHFFHTKALPFTLSGAREAAWWTLCAFAFGGTAYAIATARKSSRLLVVVLLPAVNLASGLRHLVAGDRIQVFQIRVGVVALITVIAWWYLYKSKRVVGWYRLLAADDCPRCSSDVRDSEVG